MVKRLGRIAKIILLNLVVFTVVFGALETYMRYTHPYIITDVVKMNKELAKINSSQRFFVAYTMDGRRMIPNTRSLIVNHNLSHMTVEMRINSHGFRGDEIPEKLEPGEKKILVLGDSITLAPYLPEDKIYVTIMQKKLDELMAPARALVMNAGVVDVGIKEEVDILEENGLAVRPDVVVVAFYLNDLRPPFGFPGEKDSPGWLRRHSVLAQFIFERLELRKFIKDKGLGRFDAKDKLDEKDWRTDRAAFMHLVRRTHFDWGSAWDDSEWGILDRQFDRLQADAQKNGFKVMVACFPVFFQVHANFIEDKPQCILEEKAKERGFAFIDLLPAFRAHADQDLFYDHCHLKPAGNIIAGDELAKALYQQILK